MQLSGLDKDISREDIIQNDIFDKIAAVIFFVVILLDILQGDGEHPADFGRQVIGAGDKNGVLRPHFGAKGLIGDPIPDKQVVVLPQVDSQEIIGLPDLGQIAASDNGGIFVHHANGTVDGIPHLVYKPLEQSVRHNATPLFMLLVSLSDFALFLLYNFFCAIATYFF